MTDSYRLPVGAHTNLTWPIDGVYHKHHKQQRE